ncbi:hypothetical protein GCM10025867_21260 [Frondihabitans sucicola]|uniref:Uncharacterized protein n=1 Tax=Frondihabitans sucicola TaxID=1268041 RepID=A0ABN6XY17_9MICO|nr:hypothetical protein [Frondihabitans sucicola]BDZ49885.1 hypothetical protein GCM10025867_21260 [Frondihabitans sucicola]
MQDEQDPGARDAARRRLVERAFAPDATPSDRQALAEFDRASPTSAARPADVADAPGVEPGPVDDEQAPERERRRRRRTILVAVGAAALCGVGGLAAGLSVSGRPEAAAPPADSNLTSVEKVLPAFVAPDFSGQQIAVDIPSGPIPSNLVRSSFRSAGLSDNDSSPGDELQVYVAKDTTNYDCLVVVHTGQLSSVCVSGRYFPASGLTLAWNAEKGTDIVSWLPDGTMSLSN